MRQYSMIRVKTEENSRLSSREKVCKPLCIHDIFPQPFAEAKWHSAWEQGLWSWHHLNLTPGSLTRQLCDWEHINLSDWIPFLSVGGGGAGWDHVFKLTASCNIECSLGVCYNFIISIIVIFFLFCYHYHSRVEQEGFPQNIKTRPIREG